MYWIFPEKYFMQDCDGGEYYYEQIDKLFLCSKFMKLHAYFFARAVLSFLSSSPCCL